MNSYTFLSGLQRYVSQRGVELERLTAASALTLMIDWLRDEQLNFLHPTVMADALVFRYGGWSEGCATGFKLSLLRRVTEANAQGGSTDWFAGITLMFDPARYSEMAAFSATSSDWDSIDAFRIVVESSLGYRQSVAATSMGASLESGGIR